MIDFVTLAGNYHYKVMPFSLKNVGTTYQRMMTRMFEPQLGKNIEIYIDDIVVKIKAKSEHINDPENIFGILREHKLRLNALSILLVSNRGSSWGTWSHTMELRLIMTRLRQLII